LREVAGGGIIKLRRQRCHQAAASSSRAEVSGWPAAGVWIR
jgi:hypothetical protein